MKKNLILLMGILLVLTGCQSKMDDNGKTTNSTTIKTTEISTEPITEALEDNDEETENKEEEKEPKTTKKETTTTEKIISSKTTSSTKTTTTTTTKSTSKDTTKATTTTTTKATTKATTTVKQLTEKDVYNAMIALKSKYPTGTPWSNDNYYDWKGGFYDRGYGCAGFAFMLSDAAFGSAPAKKITDMSKVRVGDIVRMNNDTHSVIVLEVGTSSITVAEGNMTVVGSFENGVYWGRKITLSELKSSGNYILTRW